VIRVSRLVVLSTLLVVPSPIGAESARGTLIEARNLAYDANYRNDQAGLRSAIASLQPLVDVPDVKAYAHYYLSWTYWALAGSQVQDKNNAGALESGKLAVEHARKGLALRDKDSEFHTALVNALVVVGFLDGSQFRTILPELMGERKIALELGPTNPRAIVMDAGVIFNSPPESGGSKERGLARYQEAARLLDAAANATGIDPIAPAWGHALIYGWLAIVHLRMTPPQKDEARKAADIALRMRPDFWYVRDQILPQLK